MNRYDQPKVTVLMPVYNGAPYLVEAIQSVLQQTFTDFEFLIIDDGSTDDSAAVIKGFHDTRIRVFQNRNNRGLVSCLNMGIKLARGEFIARMDADDVCLPERLTMQVAFFEAHQEIGICGTWVELIGKPYGQILRYPSDPNTVKCSHIFGPVLAHPTVMIRREFFDKNKLLYDPSFKHAEDFDLWVRASEFTSLSNIEKVLLRYRLHPQQVGQRHSDEQNTTAGKVRFAQLCNLGITPTSEELNIHQSISQWRFKSNSAFIEKTEKWLCKLIDANMETNIYPEPNFSAVLGERWFEVCDALTELGPRLFKMFMFSPLSRDANVSWYRRVGFFLNCLLWRKR